MNWFRFRSGMAKLAIAAGLMLAALTFGPELLLYLADCSGGSTGPHRCTYLPDGVGAILTGLMILVLFSGLFILAVVAVPILLIGGIILELAARKDAAK